ncbi:FMNH(2)-dependent dimethylsulfone monooxygenase [Capillimicrobium parvum]|uniref:FMNH(2)-dependent dimethylsulfone monooxygenase n=1 Tax=Capillimicrobium parvum TaxID=2884022 RepID=A0A9E6XXI6_9ACTN|nr:FMNH(2)-dependent dimethylsulfone monooxygenase [Capillimicrobium parvum]
MKREQNSMFWNDHFKLGLFPPNVSGGMTSTAAPERWQATWEQNLKLAQAADRAGLDFLLPASRWIGYGGETGFQRSVLETIPWASAVLACTERITAFSTVYAPLFHPILAAMQMATIDQIGYGRFGLNVVCGWRPDEFEMFGTERDWHASRYDRAAEWIELVRGVWTNEDPFDYIGDHYRAIGAQGHPKPYGGTQPIVMNAGYSEAGRRFAAKHADFFFTNVFNLDDRAARELGAFRELAAANGRPDTTICLTAMIVSRDTRAEAEEYLDHYTRRHADPGAVELIIERMEVNVPAGREAQWRERIAASSGLGLIIGSHDEVAEQLAAFAAAGYGGAAVGLVNYLDELSVVSDEIIPRLEARGVRQPTT